MTHNGLEKDYMVQELGGGAGGRSWRDGERGFVSPPSSEAVPSQAVGDLSFLAHSVSTY